MISPTGGGHGYAVSRVIDPRRESWSVWHVGFAKTEAEAIEVARGGAGRGGDLGAAGHPAAASAEGSVMAHEHVLWTLRKGAQVTEGRARMEPTGPVFVLYIDGEERWHERLADGAGVALGELSEKTRQHLEDSGWRRASGA